MEPEVPFYYSSWIAQVLLTEVFYWLDLLPGMNLLGARSYFHPGIGGCLRITSSGPWVAPLRTSTLHCWITHFSILRFLLLESPQLLGHSSHHPWLKRAPSPKVIVPFVGGRFHLMSSSKVWVNWLGMCRWWQILTKPRRNIHPEVLNQGRWSTKLDEGERIIWMNSSVIQALTSPWRWCYHVVRMALGGMEKVMAPIE